MIHAHVVNQLLYFIENQHPFLSSWSELKENIWIFYWSSIGGFFHVISVL
ncbi:MAG: hypothetical protein HC908_08400 [Calothrix sp. SM1_7_51]|nr:hypothetical protein [Calothrix sp. SM1_7_51]